MSIRKLSAISPSFTIVSECVCEYRKSIATLLLPQRHSCKHKHRIYASRTRKRANWNNQQVSSTISVPNEALRQIYANIHIYIYKNRLLDTFPFRNILNVYWAFINYTPGMEKEETFSRLLSLCIPMRSG